MKKFLMILGLFLMITGAVFAAENIPAFRVDQVEPGMSVTFIGKDFPPDAKYMISLADSETPDSFTDAAKFSTGNGGNLKINVKIPEKFKQSHDILVRMTSDHETVINGKFINIAEETPTEEPAVLEETAELTEEPAPEEIIEPEETFVPEETVELTEEPAPEESIEPEEPAVLEEPAELTEEPAPEEKPEPEEAAVPEETAELTEESLKDICDYEVFPNFTIDQVIKGKTVTVTTYNFPADSCFDVMMEGIPLSDYETGDGASRTLTFDIPQEIADKAKINIRFSDKGECGFYSLNYFWNLY